LASVLQKWARYLTAGDTIVTFNWDILHEGALWSAGKWWPTDGYGFAPSNIPDSSTHSAVTALKLHGSANWEQRNEHDLAPAIAALNVFFPTTGISIELPKGAGWSEGRYLITPSYLKDVSANRLLLKLWRQAGDAIAKASTVTVIGYRLDPADALARYLIASALERNVNVSEIVLIDPGNGYDQWDGL